MNGGRPPCLSVSSTLALQDRAARSKWGSEEPGGVFLSVSQLVVFLGPPCYDLPPLFPADPLGDAFFMASEGAIERRGSGLAPLASPSYTRHLRGAFMRNCFIESQSRLATRHSNQEGILPPCKSEPRKQKRNPPKLNCTYLVTAKKKNMTCGSTRT